ncbi:MAG: translation initiation factor IF-2 subunit alpha [Candidatus Micrarchaeota archaeon]|nr:translation initiation factor IF-2 subunit alpha [Candidatus Micrarchaeota archaeon]
MPISNKFPEQGEIIIATVKKITQFGAFCSLDEYVGQDAFIHVSEVSPGWVRSVRDYVKEGQKVVALVLRVDTVKQQIDLSLKRLSEAEKKRKMEVHNLDKRALKLLERAALKIGKKAPDTREVIPILKEEYGDLFSVFELASEGEEISSKIPAKWAAALIEIAKIEIKPKFVVQRTVVKIKSYSPNGVEAVQKILKSIEAVSTDKVKLRVLYLGAPNYYLDVTAPDYKTCEKTLAKVQVLLSSASNESTDCQLITDKPK